MAQDAVPVEAIPDVNFETLEASQRRALGNRPVIFRNAARSWPAFARWSMETLADEYGDREYDCQLNLPTDVPTQYKARDFTKKMRLREFLALAPTASYDKPCYLHQRHIRQFPGLERDVEFAQLTGLAEADPFINMWIGSAGTKSSLHFDFQHGLLAQIKGSKRFYMIDPRYSRWLSLIPGVIQKSRVDPEAPDLAKFPDFGKTLLLIGEVHEGDVIYIPAGWWHAVRGLNPSISVNYFFGPMMGFRRRMHYVAAGGWRTWSAIVRDFLWHGVLGVRLEGRLYASEPFGVWFYAQVKGYLRKRNPFAKARYRQLARSSD